MINGSELYKITILLSLGLFLIFCTANAQNAPDRGDLRFMFYNVENLFDTEDDPEKNDEEFLPDGDRYWTPKRYTQKLENIAKVITAVGQWNLPDIVGLCEVENAKVVGALVYTTYLKHQNYQILHYESPDRRGIDVALIYREDRIKILESKPIEIIYPDEPHKKTRDILYAKIQTLWGDSMHVFVNHWPSRWSGQLSSEPYRMHVAGVLRHHVDSILQSEPAPKIIIMGDLNDYPTNESLTRILQAQNVWESAQDTTLYNLAYRHTKNKTLGTHKMGAFWGVLDQIIVSGALLSKKYQTFAENNGMQIFEGDFLLEPDKNLGRKPFRTYIGFKFNNGFSDHLPIYIDIYKNLQDDE